jgi:hypothetical protein
MRGSPGKLRGRSLKIETGNLCGDSRQSFASANTDRVPISQLILKLIGILSELKSQDFK